MNNLSHVPLDVIVWLPNALFVILTVIIVFVTLQWMVNPPRSVAEGVIEAHKVVIIGGISLAAVAVVEVIQVIANAKNMHSDLLAFVLLGVTLLICDALFGLALFAAALVQDSRIREANRLDRSALLQIVCGLLVFAVASTIIIKFKSMDHEFGQLQAHANAP